MKKYYQRVGIFSKSFISLGGIIAIYLATSSCHSSNNNLSLGQNSSSENQLAIKTATLVNSPRSLSENFMCFNVNSLMVQSWRDPKFQNAVNQLNSTILRLPGGTVANYWDWQRGGIIQDISSLPGGLPQELRSRGRRYSASKLEDFQTGLEATGTRPLFVLNMLTANLDSQIQMLQTAKAMGMPVKYIELGNEFYFSEPNYTSVFATPEDYAKTASEWISGLKQEFPEAKIAVLGIVPRPQQRNLRLQNWNKSLLNLTLQQADAITLHIYREHGLDSKKNEEITTYPFFTEEDVPVILGEPFKNWDILQDSDNYKQIPENKNIWITEYNLFEKIFSAGRREKPKVIGSWAHGMYAIAMSLLFLEEERIEIICNHVLVGNSVFASILADQKSFINPSNETESATPLSLSATGSALRLLGEATQKMTRAQKINFSNNPKIIGKNDFSYFALSGWMFTNETHKNAVIINLSDQNLEVELTALFSQTVHYENVFGDPRTLVTGPGTLNEERGTVDKQITLPAYSVTKLSTAMQ